MFSIATKTWQDNAVEVKWLNEWNIQKQLRHSNLAAITAKRSKRSKKRKIRMARM